MGWGLEEQDLWRTCSNEGSLPEDETILRVTGDVGDVGDALDIVGMMEGQAWKGHICFDKGGFLQPLAHHSNSEPCLDQPNFWIKNCIMNHPNCRSLVSDITGFLPTRLVDVGRSESIRLILTGSLDSKDIKYLALSHCWGSGIPEAATTTLQNLPSRLFDIPIRSLSPSFKDVCELAQRLSVHCVWVGSLCIIQDSSEDWTRESKIMGNIFSHSYCTIGAGIPPDISQRLAKDTQGPIGLFDQFWSRWF